MARKKRRKRWCPENPLDLSMYSIYSSEREREKKKGYKDTEEEIDFPSWVKRGESMSLDYIFLICINIFFWNLWNDRGCSKWFCISVQSKYQWCSFFLSVHLFGYMYKSPPRDVLQSNWHLYTKCITIIFIVALDLVLGWVHVNQENAEKWLLELSFEFLMVKKEDLGSSSWLACEYSCNCMAIHMELCTLYYLVFLWKVLCWVIYCSGCQAGAFSLLFFVGGGRRAWENKGKLLQYEQVLNLKLILLWKWSVLGRG